MAKNCSRTHDIEDICVWPDEHWCYFYELMAGYYQHRSDDYEIVPFGTKEWNFLVQAEE